MKNNHQTDRQLALSVILIVVLALCLAGTTFALAYSMVSVEDNLFQTGVVSIDLNGGKPIINDTEAIFEPGMTLKRDFYLKNESTCDVYYKLYFENVSGGLAELLEVRVCNGEEILFAGTVRELNRQNVAAAEDVLKLGENRQLQIYFHLPQEAGNAAQNQYLTFDFAAEAVQTKNNTNKEFD